MSFSYLTLSPHDPIIARDSRPFGFGTRMRSLDWPYPSVLAGSLRTLLGKENCPKNESEKAPEINSEKIIEILKKIPVSGPFPLSDNQLLFPAPRDLLIQKGKDSCRIFPIRPAMIREGEGCDLPDESLLPSQIPDFVDDEFKPDRTPPLWSAETMIQWLTTPDGNPNLLPSMSSGVFDLPEKDIRIHVMIDPKLGASQDGMLFQTTGLDLSLPGNSSGMQIAARIGDGGDYQQCISGLNEYHPFGGERRLAHWKAVPEHFGWQCPDKVESAVSGSRRIRLILASPAIFSGGWIPGWLSKQDNGFIEGTPPGAPEGVKLRLVSACIDRWKPISGWNLETRSPKPVRRIVPAGSVYFFTVCEGSSTTSLASSCWLTSVCEDRQDRRDGFGLALWGVWDKFANMIEKSE